MCGWERKWAGDNAGSVYVCLCMAVRVRVVSWCMRVVSVLCRCVVRVRVKGRVRVVCGDQGGGRVLDRGDVVSGAERGSVGDALRAGGVRGPGQ